MKEGINVEIAFIHVLYILKTSIFQFQVSNEKFCREVNMNTTSQIFISSNKLVGIQSEATKDV